MAIEFGMSIEEGIKPLLKKPHVLEYEKTFFPFIIISKKRYIGNLYEKDPDKYKQKNINIIWIFFNIKNNFYKYSLSSLFHLAWLKNPLISKCYLTLVHTPRHYLTIYKRKHRVAQQFLIGVGTSVLAIPFLNANLDSILNNKLGDLWFVAPIIAHITVHSYYNKIITSFID